MVPAEDCKHVSLASGPVTCPKCQSVHPEDSDQAEFIGWNGHCAVCELTDMDADLASRARNG